jgi:tetratricopeptide (TPR) repeat protein
MSPSGVTLIVGPEGPSRSAFLAQTIEPAQDALVYVRLLRTDRREGGVWSGLSDLLEDWARWAEAAAPEILARHRHEIAGVSPHRRNTEGLSARSLAETAPGDERIRVLPADRTDRTVQGLIDFLTEAAAARGTRALVLGCEGYDRASKLARFFFPELLRRRGELEVSLVLTATPEGAQAVFEEWRGDPIREVLRPPLDPAPEPDESLDPISSRAARTAEELSRDSSRAEVLAWQLVEDWRRCGETRRALRAQANLLALCNQGGFYRDALEIAEDLCGNFETLCGQDENARLGLLVQLYLTLVATGRAARALEILEREGVPRVRDARLASRIDYMLAMLHLRFLPQRDADLAERHLLLSVEQAKESSAAEDERQFAVAFALNGLALVRLRQGRPAEALELCRDCLQRIETHFSHGRHMLFRSVLIYNIAQVHAGMQNVEEALTHYTAAIGIDPNYSEYYNERGALLLRLGRFQEAAADYRRALTLSPPSAETFTNLGQCHRLLGDAAQAVEAYTRAIDLGATQILPFAGRAQSLRALGRLDEACADYESVLRREPALPLVWANRAAIHYTCGRFAESLTDLDEAIRLAPDNPDLYRNRALALTALGRAGEATLDEEQAARLAAGAAH